MMKENKFKMVISSVVVLLPMLFGMIMWNAFPETMTTHWGAGGNADGFGGKAFVVFGVPVLLLFFHFISMFFTLNDKRQKEQNKKALGITFWIVPYISCFISGILYGIGLGKEINVMMMTPAFLGILFIIIGNYMPKTKQNSTLGIKISWTLNNEENWNKTHRFAGKVWVIGGFVMVFSMFQLNLAIVAMLVCVIIPIVYSYNIYKKHQKEGIKYVSKPKSKKEKMIARIGSVVGVVVMIGILVLIFTGNIKVQFEDRSFRIQADYWTDSEVQYEEIDTVSYREDLDKGVRTSGFGSAKLSMGIFQNDEFGSYTLYAYNGAKEFVVLTSGDRTLVIGMKDVEEAKEIYDTILGKMGR